MTGVITATQPSWITPFTGLSPRCFTKLVAAVRREDADDHHRGRPWHLPLRDRALLVLAYWRTNLTMRQLAPLFGISKSAVGRIIGRLGPVLALRTRRRFAPDAVLIVDGTLVPARDHEVAEQSKDYRYSTSSCCFQAAASLSPDLHQASFSSDVSDCWTYTSAHRQRFAQEEGSQQRGVAAWLPA